MKSLKIFMLFVQVCLLYSVEAQKEGDTWVIGYYGYGDPRFCIMHIDFSELKPNIEFHFNEKLNMKETVANICDVEGNALIWTNGMEIFGTGGKNIADKISFDPDTFSYWHYFSPDGDPIGFPVMDGAVVLPVP